MACKSIITIARQYGSAGREIGEKLAEELGIPCYDKELLERAAEESGISKELFENHDEKPNNSFLYSLVMDTYSGGYPTTAFSGLPLNHKIFLAQFNAIKKVADESPCVIVGRCADYALSEYSNCISVFIHSDMPTKIKRIMEKYDLSEKKAEEKIVKTDKQRSSYYNYYSNKKWGTATAYNLSVSSGACGIDATVSLLKHFVELRENEQ